MTKELFIRKAFLKLYNNNQLIINESNKKNVLLVINHQIRRNSYTNRQSDFFKCLKESNKTFNRHYASQVKSIEVVQSLIPNTDNGTSRHETSTTSTKQQSFNEEGEDLLSKVNSLNANNKTNATRLTNSVDKSFEIDSVVSGQSEFKKEKNIFNLKEDSNRKELGLEPTESFLENGWKEVKIDFKKLAGYYSKLSKRNLTALVVSTTMMGCVMAPIPFDPFIFFITTLGTTLTSTSANTFNQFLEVPYDSQMNRTKDRVLVRGHLTPLHAFTFATITGVVGVGTLFFLINPLTAALGASTLFLYTMIYTPMKRLSALNTWIGSVVGAIPPLMGYTAMTGQIGAGGILLAAILYSWQFPHFHALSWNLRAEYSRAGYRMISVLNPRICTSSSLSHTIALTVMCSYLAPMLELTTWNFAIDSLPFNLYFIYLAFQFKRNGDAPSSRKLFRYSLIYLPMVILLMLITKYPIENKTPTELEKTEQLLNKYKEYSEKLKFSDLDHANVRKIKMDIKNSQLAINSNELLALDDKKLEKIS